MSVIDEAPYREAFAAANERMENYTPTERWDRGGCAMKTAAVLDAAIPHIRKQVVDEIVARLREPGVPYNVFRHSYADLIAREFGS